jgi:SAM-dependent methyltransferase
LSGGRASLKSFIPWYAKIAAKIVLSRLPIGYRTWRRLNLFAHGDMDQLSYAQDKFRQHFLGARVGRNIPEFRCLELGPGDSLLSALIARVHGASRVVLVDSGDFAHSDLDSYRTAARELDPGGLVLHPATWTSRDALLRDCKADYLTGGLQSLYTLPAESIDFAWSEAVLEHIRRSEFDELLRELHRVLAADGVASHRVDLKDHLGGGLNNLRFSAKRWEGRLFSGSGFYTNRLRCEEVLEACRRAGFRTTVTRRDRFDSLPLSRRSLDPAFAHFGDEELLISGFDVMLTRS